MDEQTKAALIGAELEEVARGAEDGLLHPEAVVEYAKANPASAIHGEMEWDDKAAAHEHRLAQARNLIRVHVVVLPNTPKRVRAFVSIPTDRANGGGYRRTTAALKSDAMRQQLVEDVLKRVESLKTNVSMLPELEGLFARIGVVIAEYRAAQFQRSAAA